jgi:putative spermidine/putrescine transport system permease protein
MTGRFALNVFVALVAAFLVLPILAIVPAAFSAQSFIRLPPDAWSLRWWGSFFNDISWRVTLLSSLKVAAFTTLVSVMAGTPAALGIARSSPRVRALLTSLFLAPWSRRRSSSPSRSTAWPAPRGSSARRLHW